ncbi:glycosyltransferase family 4 protein [Clostridiisalibacter paucivorans]|uniref:glycosyltransferase family 4 protein n=1 Tax=Clostridiisalibacter paucivorans TaxID=408753 RepID=UPI00047E05A7|nr:MraY family glycosyltransferase [Clostridiisalibacter paucivorans]
MYKYYVPFFIALVISYIATPFAKKFAYKLGAIDIPKDGRRVHKKPIPRLGGLAIYFSTVICLVVFVFLGEITMDKELMAIILGGTIITLTGIIDDIKPMSAKTKLFLQILAAMVVVFGGIKITFINDPFESGYATLSLNGFSIPITVIWIVGITNTLNLIDGLDGLAAGVAGIASMSMLFVASGFVGIDPIYTVVMTMAAIVAGAALGFLPHNFNPAKIFMGDTGSLFLGYMLAVMSIRGVMKSVTAVSVILPVIILGLPIFDTACAILRRLIKRRPIMEADKGHLHHRLLERGLSQRQTVLILYVISIGLGMLAVKLSGMEPNMSLTVLGIIFIPTALLMTQMSVNDINNEKHLKNKR